MNGGTTVSGIEKTGSILIQFSEPMNPVETEDAVSFSPAVSSFKSWPNPDQLLIQVLPHLEPESTYTLRINTTAQDSADNALNDNYSYTFVTNGVASVRPLITEVRQRTSDSPGNPLGGNWDPVTPYITPFLNINRRLSADHLIDTLNGPGENLVVQVEVVFNNPVARSNLDKITSLSGVIVTDGGDVEIDKIDVNANIMIIDLKPKPFPASDSIFRLKINGGDAGLMDLNGNTMAEDYNLYLRVP